LEYAPGRRSAILGSFDVIILDVLLAGSNGFDLCRSIRRDGVSAPLMMLTALDAVENKVGWLEVGAEDYLTKPFEFRELVARIRALMRRPQPCHSVAQHDCAANAGRNSERAAKDAERHGFDEKLKEDRALRGAECLSDSNLTRALGD
jgi:DNA-binding response OmpR family regulator